MWSYLYSNDKTYSYEKVIRWTRTEDLFLHKRLFIPININNYHWVFLLVLFISSANNNPRDMMIEISHYDSFSNSKRKEKSYMNDNIYTQHITHWLKDESWTRRNIQLEDSNFRYTIHNRTIPQQKPDSNNCGAYVCAYADYLIDDLDVSLIQNIDMDKFRLKIGTDIIRGSLLYDGYSA